MQSPNKKDLHKSSTAEHDASNRQQPLLLNDLHSRKLKQKSQFNYSDRRDSPMSKSIHVLDEFHEKEEDLRKVVSTVDLQTKISVLEGQLSTEKRKSNRFRKIIHSKLEKEKELQDAYRNIFVELKKQAIANPSCFCKSKVSYENKTRNGNCQETNGNNEKEHDIIEEVIILRMENSKLKRELEQATQKYLEIKNKLLKDEVEEWKVKSNFYQNEVNKLVQQNQRIAKELKESHIKGLINSKISSKKQSKSGQQDINQDQFVQPEAWKSLHSANNIFKTFEGQIDNKRQQSQVEEVDLLKGIKRRSGVLSNEKEQQSNEMADSSFNTVSSISKQSFKSIIAQKDEKGRPSLYSLNNNNDQSFRSIAALPGFQEVSNVSNINYIESSQRGDSASELNYFFDDQMDKNNREDKLLFSEVLKDSKKEDRKSIVIPTPQEILIKCLVNLRTIFSSVQNALKQFGSSQDVSFNFDEVFEMIASAKNNKKSSLVKLQLAQNRAEQIGNEIHEKLKKIEQLSSKQLKKIINNYKMELSQKQNQRNKFQFQKEVLNNKIQTLNQYKNKLQLQIQQLDPSAPSIRSSQHHTFLHDIYRSKITMAEPTSRDMDTQCSIISQMECQRNEDFIAKIPIFINQELDSSTGLTLKAKEFSILGNLESQFKQTIQNTISLIKKHIVSTHYRKKSLNLVTIKSDKDLEPSMKWEVVTPKGNIQASSPVKVQVHEKNGDNILDELQIERMGQLQAENELLTKECKERHEEIQLLKEKIEDLKVQLKKIEEVAKVTPPVTSKLLTQRSISHLSQISPIKLKQKNSVGLTEQDFGQDQVQFMQPSQIRPFNNIKVQRQQEVKELRIRIDQLQRELQGYKTKYGTRKKKVFYINH